MCRLAIYCLSATSPASTAVLVMLEHVPLASWNDVKLCQQKLLGDPGEVKGFSSWFQHAWLFLAPVVLG